MPGHTPVIWTPDEILKIEGGRPIGPVYVRYFQVAAENDGNNFDVGDTIQLAQFVPGQFILDLYISGSTDFGVDTAAKIADDSGGSSLWSSGVDISLSVPKRWVNIAADSQKWFHMLGELDRYPGERLDYPFLVGGTGLISLTMTTGTPSALNDVDIHGYFLYSDGQPNPEEV